MSNDFDPKLPWAVVPPQDRRGIAGIADNEGDMFVHPEDIGIWEEHAKWIVYLANEYGRRIQELETALGKFAYSVSELTPYLETARQEARSILERGEE